MHRLIFVFCLTLSFLQSSSHAGDSYFFSGNVLSEYMAQYQKAARKDKDANFSSAWAFRAYVIGVHDTTSGILFCAPEKADDVQVTTIVAKFMENNPQYWNLSGPRIVTMALSEAFPCPKKP